MVDLTPLINAVIAILAAIITPKIVAWFNVRLDAEERKELLAWVRIGVAAAEQLYESNQGQEKKQFVLGFLHEQGFDVDVDDINNAIEAAVLELHKGLANG